MAPEQIRYRQNDRDWVNCLKAIAYLVPCQDRQYAMVLMHQNTEREKHVFSIIKCRKRKHVFLTLCISSNHCVVSLNLNQDAEREQNVVTSIHVDERDEMLFPLCILGQIL